MKKRESNYTECDQIYLSCSLNNSYNLFTVYSLNMVNLLSYSSYNQFSYFRSFIQIFFQLRIYHLFNHIKKYDNQVTFYLENHRTDLRCQSEYNQSAIP